MKLPGSVPEPVVTGYYAGDEGPVIQSCRDACLHVYQRSIYKQDVPR